MAGVRIDSPLMSRNIVEIFDIIDSVTIELKEQRRALGEIEEMLAENRLSDYVRLGDLLSGMRASANHCHRILG